MDGSATMKPPTNRVRFAFVFFTGATLLTIYTEPGFRPQPIIPG
jgi:hypothetical protein